MLVDKNYYTDVFKGIPIANDTEFSQLSQRAEQILDTYAFSRIPKWNNDTYLDLKRDGSDYQKSLRDAVCMEIETLFQANGIQATTGGADAGRVPLIDGVPLSGMAKSTIERVLNANNLIYRGV